MTFLSREFAYFFLIVFSLRWLLPGRFRNAWLLAASLWFYCSWNWHFVFLLAVVTFSAYALAQAIEARREGPARTLLAGGAVFMLIGVVAWFKLSDPLVERFEILRGASLLGYGVFHRGWVLPLGLSYYTFQALGYVLDVYRGAAPARGFLDFALFLSFFPHIMAGPIARAKTLLPQLERDAPFDWRRFDEGCHLIFWGLFQKVFVAENLAVDVRAIFDGPAPATGGLALLGLYAFALQLFADFSGYTDLARGLAKCLGFDLAPNFNLPFFALDLQDAWKRWHMSLSSWFSDYVYRPMLDLPFPFFKLYAAPVATMVLMGLWHGARPTTLVMGLYYGLVIAATMRLKVLRLALTGSTRPVSGAAAWASRALTFHLFILGLLLLRADTLSGAAQLAWSIPARFSLPPQAWDLAKRLLFFAGPLAALQGLCYFQGDAGALYRLPAPARAVLYACLLCLILLGGKFESDEIFYRRF